MSSETRDRKSCRGMVIAVGLAVVAGAVAFWATRMVVCSKPAHPGLCALGESTHLIAELGLDDRQTAEVRALDRELAAQLSDQCGQYCAVRAELGAVLLAGGTNAVVVSRQLVNRMCAVQAASELATLQHIQKVSAILSPEQRKTFLSGLTRCLCGSGGLCAGGCKEMASP